MAVDPPEPPRLRATLGLGRDERTPIKEAAVGYPRDKMHRRLVVGRGARRHAGRRSGDGYKR